MRRSLAPSQRRLVQPAKRPLNNTACIVPPSKKLCRLPRAVSRPVVEPQILQVAPPAAVSVSSSSPAVLSVPISTNCLLTSTKERQPAGSLLARGPGHCAIRSTSPVQPPLPDSAMEQREPGKQQRRGEASEKLAVEKVSAMQPKPKSRPKWRGRMPKHVETSSDSEEPEEPMSLTLMCVCRQPYSEGSECIGCDGCNEWFHPECIGMSNSVFMETQNEESEWFCKACKTGGRGSAVY